jgi:glycine cleavage system transcriptional repressor
MKEYIITVLVPDRVGIVAGIARAVWEQGGNALEISQTVVRGYFTVLVSATLPDPLEPVAIQAAVREAVGAPDMHIAVAPHCGTLPPAAGPDAERFVLTVLGKDKPGIVCQLCSCLADHRVNIIDFSGKVRGEEFELVLELELPARVDPRRLKTELEQVGASFGLRAHLLHENLFVATNSVRPVRALRGGRS